MRNPKYFLPFASPENFIKGKNAAHSLNLEIVESASQDDCPLECILGSDMEKEGQEIQREVFTTLGLPLDDQFWTLLSHSHQNFNAWYEFTRKWKFNNNHQ